LVHLHQERAEIGDDLLERAHDVVVHVRPSVLQSWSPFGKNPAMPARQRARRVTVRQVLETAIELEKKTMALYVSFVKAFPRPEEVRNFWFGMARHEAGHCGALALVESIVHTDPERGEATKVWLDEATVSRLRSLLGAYLREVRSGDVSLERAFEM